jgi:hypothetical protein
MTRAVFSVTAIRDKLLAELKAQRSHLGISMLRTAWSICGRPTFPTTKGARSFCSPRTYREYGASRVICGQYRPTCRARVCRILMGVARHKERLGKVRQDQLGVAFSA